MTDDVVTSDGVRLEAELAEAEGQPTSAAVVCHPHPLYGGNMHANVVDALFRALPETGTTVLRFNFRGAGGSGGSHDGGKGERLDVAAAVAAMADRAPDVPLLLAGYSFGADVSLTVDDDAVAGWLAVAPPLRVVDRSEMAALTDARPTTVLGAVHDQFNPYDTLAQTLADAPSTSVLPVQGADHFFAVGLNEVVTAARAAIDELTRREA